MPKFIMIDNKTGFVWGQTEADTALQGCLKLHRDVGKEPGKYAWNVRPDFAKETGYHVYDGTGFDIDSVGGGDGQDPELIAAVEALPKIGYFREVEPSDGPEFSAPAAGQAS